VAATGLVSSSSSCSSSPVTTKSLSGGKKHLSTSHCYWICVHCMYVRRHLISGTVHFVHCCAVRVIRAASQVCVRDVSLEACKPFERRGSKIRFLRD
jgi:hypothetical protein